MKYKKNMVRRRMQSAPPPSHHWPQPPLPQRCHSGIARYRGRPLSKRVSYQSPASLRLYHKTSNREVKIRGVQRYNTSPSSGLCHQRGKIIVRAQDFRILGSFIEATRGRRCSPTPPLSRCPVGHSIRPSGHQDVYQGS